MLPTDWTHQEPHTDWGPSNMLTNQISLSAGTREGNGLSMTESLQKSTGDEASGYKHMKRTNIHKRCSFANLSLRHTHSGIYPFEAIWENYLDRRITRTWIHLDRRGRVYVHYTCMTRESERIIWEVVTGTVIYHICRSRVGKHPRLTVEQQTNRA